MAPGRCLSSTGLFRTILQILIASGLSEAINTVLPIGIRISSYTYPKHLQPVVIELEVRISKVRSIKISASSEPE